MEISSAYEGWVGTEGGEMVAPTQSADLEAIVAGLLTRSQGQSDIEGTQSQ